MCEENSTKFSWCHDITLSIGEHSTWNPISPSNGLKCFSSLTFMIYYIKMATNLEISFYRQVHRIVVVFHVQGLLLTLFSLLASSTFIVPCLSRSKVHPSQTLQNIWFWLIQIYCHESLHSKMDQFEDIFTPPESAGWGIGTTTTIRRAMRDSID